MMTLTDCQNAKKLSIAVKELVLDTVASEITAKDAVLTYLRLIPKCTPENVDDVICLAFTLLHTADRFSLSFDKIFTDAVLTAVYGAKEAIYKDDRWFTCEVLNFNPWLGLRQSRLSPESFVMFGATAIYVLLLESVTDENYHAFESAITAAGYDEGF